MMTIVHVETGRHLYGGPLQVYYLLRGLKTRGVRNILVCPEGSAIAQAAAEVAEVRALPMRGDLDLGFMVRLRRLLRTEKPALLHLHSRRGSDVLGGIAGRLAQVRCVLTRRVDNPEPRMLVRLKYDLYDRVITISEGIQKVLLGEGVPLAKLQTARDAVDTERFRPGCRWPDWRQAFNLAPDSPVVGMAAQMIERKGHRYLLEAAPHVLTAIPSTRFLIFGRGPLESRLREEVTRRGLTEQIRFVGFREDLDRLLPCLDLLVHPATLEGLGVILLQAAACQLPIVAAAAGGIPEVVRDGVNGRLVAPGDARALAKAMLELLHDTGRRRRMGAAGRRIVEEEFSIDAMVEGNLRVYRGLLASTNFD
ncbi:glycosyl transferase [Sulfurifustis variabilis]|uniref:Glycosyl transferase n=1 Tax=Sulfurifustis variabilis TaxID=1675686 RepID=A0A1C7AFY2_9GAMM|nr:glycosyltransferase [Sulfurifustis variabilis]BAU50338.1 glycosyl transferase [Sulfurifustis variabilis]